VVTFTLVDLPLRKSPWYPLNRKPGRLQNPFVSAAAGRMSCPFWEVNHNSLVIAVLIEYSFQDLESTVVCFFGGMLSYDS